MRGWSLDSIIKKVSQPGPNNQRVAIDRNANVLRANSLANRGLVGKPAGCSGGHDQSVEPAKGTNQNAEPGEPTACSMVDCISKGYRMIDYRLVTVLCTVAFLIICFVVFVVVVNFVTKVEVTFVES